MLAIGDKIYYYQTEGNTTNTIPATVLKTYRPLSNGRRIVQILGDFPNGDSTRVVSEARCEKQENAA